MSFILFYIFRRFFVKISYDPQKITITKGIFLVRTAVVPLRSIVRITVRRSLLLRLFRAKEIEVFCNLGSVKLFLGRDEIFPPLGEFSEPPSLRSATFAEETLGAFSDTHALGGMFLLSAALARVSRLLGSEYSERLSALLGKLLSDAAGNIGDLLSKLNIYVPRAVAIAAVFALAAWCFAFARKRLDLARFRVFVSEERVLVRSGLLTLYEHTLFPNYSAAVREEGIISLIAGRAPVRMRGVIVFPAAQRSAASAKSGARSPKTALWGHCGVPLTAAAVMGAALGWVNLSERLRDYELLKTALFCGLAAALYAAAVFAVYMRYSGIFPAENGVAVVSRKSLRLRTAVIPRERIVSETARRNLLNKRRGNVTIRTRDRLRFKVRQIPLDQY